VCARSRVHAAAAWASWRIISPLSSVVLIVDLLLRIIVTARALVLDSFRIKRELKHN
jgi:hypothetical protein